MWDEARNILSLKAFLYNLKSSPFYANFFFHPPLYMVFASLLTPFKAGFDIRLEILSLLFSYAALIAVYLLSARIGGWKYAALSGLFLSIMPVSTGYDTWIKRDSLASALGYLAVLLLCKRKFLWCAVALSFSLLSKESALFFMLSSACILFLMKEKKAPEKIMIGCGIIFALTSWWYVFFSDMPKNIFGIYFSIKHNMGTWVNSPHYYFKKLAPDMGIPLLLFFIIGISRLFYLILYKKQYRWAPPLIITLCVYIPASFFIAAKTPWLCLSASPALAMVAGGGAVFLLRMADKSKFLLSVFSILLVFVIYTGLSFSYSGYHMKTYPNGWPGAHSSRELALYLNNHSAGTGDRLMITEFAYWKMPICPVFLYYWKGGEVPIEVIRGRWTPQMVMKEIANKKMSWFVIADSPDPEYNLHAFVKEITNSALGKPAVVEWSYVWKTDTLWADHNSSD